MRNRIFCTFISIILVAVMASISPLTSLSRAEEVIKEEKNSENISTNDDRSGISYVKDIKLFDGKDKNEAKKKCESAGYIFQEGNLNEGVSDKQIYIGYKPTTNEREAIRDISMLHMGMGYRKYDYRIEAEKMMNKLSLLAQQLLVMTKEFSENLKKKSPLAIVARDTLNNYTVDEQDNMPFGDFLASEKCSLDFLQRYLSRSDNNMINLIYMQLAAGVAACDDKDCWAKKVKSAKSKDFSKLSKSEKKFLETAYDTEAKELTTPLKEFLKEYKDAKAKENLKLREDLSFDKDGDGIPEEYIEEVKETADNQKDKEIGQSQLYISAIDELNKYDYDENTKLGDYIVALDDEKFTSDESIRKLYPIVEAMTTGQLYSTKISGLLYSIIYLENDSKILDEATTKLEEVKKKIKEITGKEKISIWYAVNKELYEKEIVLTDEAKRANDAGTLYSELTYTPDRDEFDEVNYYITIITSSISVAWMLADLGVYIFGTGSLWAVSYAAIGTGIMASILGVIGLALNIIGWIAFAISIGYMLYKLYKEMKDDDIEDAPEYEEPCEAIYSFEKYTSNGIQKAKMVRYEGVKCGSKTGDLNCGSGIRWNALYYTKDKNIGSPLCVDEAENVFLREVDNAKSCAGYESVSRFGQSTPCDLNSYVENTKKSIYLHYRTVESIANKEVNVPDEEKEETKHKKKYLSGLILASEKTEAAAKAKIEKSAGNYKLLDVNLTKGCTYKSDTFIDEYDGIVQYSKNKDKTFYTYLGYTTTTNKDMALTDIRIGQMDGADKAFLGDASYAMAGKTLSGDVLYYTTHKTAGTPIEAELEVVDNVAKAPSGYEPVNLLSGGPAYNFRKRSGNMTNITVMKDLDGSSDGECYIYFKPEKTFTSGEKYISGLFVIRTSKGKLEDAKKTIFPGQDIKTLGGSLTSNYISFSKGDWLFSDKMYLEKNSDNIGTICYTTTYNPYRAIYDVKLYNSFPGTYALMSSISSQNGSYASCEYVEYRDTKRNQKVAKYGKRHSYIFDRMGTYSACQEENVPCAWDYSNQSLKGLYVLGNLSEDVNDMNPLREGELVISDNRFLEKENPESYMSVRELKNKTKSGVEGANNIDLKLNTGEEKDGTYLYIFDKEKRGILKDKATEKKKYISSIYVANGDACKDDMADYAKEACMNTLFNACSDEILYYNLDSSTKDNWYSKYTTTYFDEEDKDIKRGLTDYTKKSAYIGVSRTDEKRNAIRDIIKFVVANDKQSVKETIKLRGCTYKKAGDMINDGKQCYYLYYTTNAAAGFGCPITKLYVNDEPIQLGVKDALTVLEYSKEDTSIPWDVDEDDEDFNPYDYYTTSTSSDAINYIHMEYDKGFDEKYYESFCVGSGKTKKEALVDVLRQGYQVAMNCDFDFDVDGAYSYIGYKKFAIADDADLEYAKQNAVTDIIFTQNEACEEEKQFNGLTYYLASKSSLNGGSFGDDIYMYYTNELTNDIKSPIVDLRGYVSERVPDISKESVSKHEKYEHVLDAKGEPMDLNSGVYVCDADDTGSVMDNVLRGKGKYNKEGNRAEKGKDVRIYLYARREDNSVKTGAEIKGGISSDVISGGVVNLGGDNMFEQLWDDIW